MRRVLFQKMLRLIPVWIGITFLSFAVIHLAPGSPVDFKTQMNYKMTPQAKERLTELYGLRDPVLLQYARWCRRLARLDFGQSFADGEPVLKKIGRAMPVTLGLNGLSLLVVILLGIPLGVFGAVRREQMPDKVLGVALFAGYCLPTFWLALLAMSFFGVTLRILPVSGLHSLFFENQNALEKAGDVARHLILPVTLSSLTALAGLSRYVRASVIAALKQPYIRAGRALGLSEPVLLYRHALKNALLPCVTLLGLSIPGLLGGSVVFETVFSIPGMGRLFFNSVFARDYPVLMGILVMGAFLTLAGNALADVAYSLIDPRVRAEGQK